MPGGRPRIEIDWAEFDRLGEVQCTLAELSAHFGVSEDTIERAVKREVTAPPLTFEVEHIVPECADQPQ